MDDFCFIPLYFGDSYSRTVLLFWTWMPLCFCVVFICCDSCLMWSLSLSYIFPSVFTCDAMYAIKGFLSILFFLVSIRRNSEYHKHPYRISRKLKEFAFIKAIQQALNQPSLYVSSV